MQSTASNSPSARIKAAMSMDFTKFAELDKAAQEEGLSEERHIFPSDSRRYIKVQGVKVQVAEKVEAVPERWEAAYEKHVAAKLMKLDAAKRDDGITYWGNRSWGSSIAFIGDADQESLLPLGKSETPFAAAKPMEGQVKLQCSFSQLAVAPGIQITFFLHRGERNEKGTGYAYEHKGSLSFYFNPIYDHHSKTHKTCIRKDTFTYKYVPAGGQQGLPQYVELTFVADHVVSTNLVPPEHFDFKLSEEECQMFAYMLKISTQPGSKVRIRCYPHKYEIDAMLRKGDRSGPPALDLAAAHLPGRSSETAALKDGKNFAAYKHRMTEKANVQHNQMIARHDIAAATNGTIVPFPTTSSFVDATHGEIALGYGHSLEFEEQRITLMAVANAEHICTVHRIPGAILVGVTLQEIPQTGFGNVHFSIPEGTKVMLNIETKEASYHVAGITVYMRYDVSPPASFHVLLMGRHAAKLESVAKPGLRLSNPTAYRVHVNPEVTETTIAAQLDAVRKAYDPAAENGSQGQLLDLLLFNGQDFKTTNPWGLLENQEATDTAFKDLLNAYKWTDAQRKVINGTKHLVHKMLLVTGCGGSGKTLIQLCLIHAWVQAGGKAACISDRNSVLDRLLLTYVNMFPDDPFPLRVYPQQRSVSSLIPRDDEEASDDLNPEERAIFEFVAQQIKESKKTHPGVAEYSIEGHIAWHIKAKTEHLIKFVGKGDDGKPVAPDPLKPESINVFEYLEQALARIRGHREQKAAKSDEPDEENIATDPNQPGDQDAATEPTPPTKPEALFTEDEERWLKQAWMAARKFVISNAPFVLVTPVTSSTDEFRKYFAAGDNDRVFMHMDEGTTMHEASVLIPLAKCWKDYGHKVVGIVMYGDPKQLGPMNFGSDGADQRPSYNEFRGQIDLSLFKRLMNNGITQVTLEHQARMHEALWKPAMRIFYDYTIACNGDASRFELPAGWNTMIRQLHGFTDTMSLSDTKLRLAYFEVAGNHTRRSRTTGSRANLVNLEIVTGLVKDVLAPIFQSEMSKSVVVVTPYQRQRQMYSAVFARIKKEQGWTDEQLPSVRVIDGMVGDERDVVLLDLVVSVATAKGMGFMRDNERNCVAFTRAKKAMWVIGSDFVPQDNRLKEYADSEIQVRSLVDAKKCRKNRHQRRDQFGNVMQEFTVLEYHQTLQDAGVKKIMELPKIHPLDWPTDLMESKYYNALPEVRKLFFVEHSAGSFLYLSDDQKAEFVRIAEEVETYDDRLSMARMQHRAGGSQPNGPTTNNSAAA